MTVTVRNTSLIGIRGMARPRVLRSPDCQFPSPGIGFRMTGSRCVLSPGRVLAEALMSFLELSCWCVTGIGLVVVIALALL